MLNTIGQSKEDQEIIHTAWADMLKVYPWEAFATLTFANPRRDPFEIINAFKVWLYKWCEAEAVDRDLLTVARSPRVDAYGREIGQRVKRKGPFVRQWKKGVAKPVWVVGVERFKDSRDLHLHALIRSSSYLPDLNRRAGWNIWKNVMNMGRGRIEPPEDQDHVNRYVSKYIVKDGEVYLSETFDTPGSCRNELFRDSQVSPC